MPWFSRHRPAEGPLAPGNRRSAPGCGPARSGAHAASARCIRGWRGTCPPAVSGAGTGSARYRAPGLGLPGWNVSASRYINVMTTFSVRPDAPFSLSAAAGFGFGPRTGRPKPAGSQMRLAFVTDDMAHHAAVYLAQGSDGTVAGEVETDGDAEAAWRQVLRILSLDHPGAPWARVGARDPVIGRLQGQYPGLRPVLFHSPYEAAAWAIISARRYRSTAAVIRDHICDEIGQVPVIAGEQARAF